jgi:pantetheine-phosphate adenylyltransferase
VFSIEERLQIASEVLPAGVEVVAFRGLVVEFCRQQGFSAILRGLRTVSDFEYEYQLALTNRHLVPDVETVFVMPSARFAFVSSSLIKDIVRYGGDVSAFLPDSVERRLRARLQQED